MPSRSKIVIAVTNVPPFGRSTATRRPFRSARLRIDVLATTCIASSWKNSGTQKNPVLKNTLTGACERAASKSARERQRLQLSLRVGFAPFLSPLIPGAGLRGVRQRTIGADLPEQRRIIGRADEQGRPRIPRLGAAHQQQP